MSTPVPRLSGLVSLVLALAACSGGGVRAAPPTEAPLLGDAWFAARGPTLGLDAAAARARDAAISEAVPPEQPPDAQLRTQAAAIWATLCASCHGATGRLENVAPTPPDVPLPRAFGGARMAMGFFFGGDKMRAGLYRKIARGAPPTVPPSPMPPWESTLSREQIWALVAHIESL
jgi:mono/diheme cytochrome c family protein